MVYRSTTNLIIICAALTTALSAFSHIRGEEPPSMEQIKAAIDKQNEQVKSLYIEAKNYSTTSIDPQVLITWPKYKSTLFLFTEENYFAYKGGKRYARRIQPAEAKLLQPIKSPEVDPKASPGMQKLQKEGVAQNERYERENAKMERMGMKVEKKKESGVIELMPDDARGDNGKIIWERRIDSKNGTPQLFISRRDPKREWVQTDAYLSAIGWDCATEANTKDEGVLKAFLYRVENFAKNSETSLGELDGTKCVIIKQTVTPDDERLKMFVGGKHTLWRDLNRGFAVLKAEHQYDNGDFVRTIHSDFVEILPGIWFPKKIEVQNFAPKDAPQEYQDKPVLIYHHELTKWSVNDVPDELFNAVPKPKDQVYDSRQYQDMIP
jgi:hypothetical protein